jgi:hypothetical protein
MVQDMSSAKFPRIPRTNEQVVGGWASYVNKNGREGSDPIIRDAFTVGANREEAENEGHEQHAELEERPECG